MNRDLTALEHRRYEALRLVGNGMKQVDVARQLSVSRQTVSRWVRTEQTEGPAALKRSTRLGRRRELDGSQRDALLSLLNAGPTAAGQPGRSWTCASVARLIESTFGVTYHRGHVWKLLAEMGWQLRRRNNAAESVSSVL